MHHYDSTQPYSRDLVGYGMHPPQHSEPVYAALGHLTATYLSDAHRACAQKIAADMRLCGCVAVWL